jgi:hypothetical protein
MLDEPTDMCKVFSLNPTNTYNKKRVAYSYMNLICREKKIYFVSDSEISKHAAVSTSKEIFFICISRESVVHIEKEKRNNRKLHRFCTHLLPFPLRHSGEEEKEREREAETEGERE